MSVLKSLDVLDYNAVVCWKNKDQTMMMISDIEPVLEKKKLILKKKKTTFSHWSQIMKGFFLMWKL